MRSIIAAAALAAGLGLATLPGAVAAPGGLVAGDATGVLESVVDRVQYWRGGYCERLRRACEYKDERGEWGQGNCRRYREECTGRVSYCERLRRACIYKDDRGEWGQGNCRRYRYECGGRY
jgi:hypothetical protein